jgi:hypothetical protein
MEDHLKENNAIITEYAESLRALNPDPLQFNENGELQIPEKLPESPYPGAGKQAWAVEQFYKEPRLLREKPLSKCDPSELAKRFDDTSYTPTPGILEAAGGLVKFAAIIYLTQTSLDTLAYPSVSWES